MGDFYYVIFIMLPIRRMIVISDSLELTRIGPNPLLVSNKKQVKNKHSTYEIVCQLSLISQAE